MFTNRLLDDRKAAVSYLLLCNTNMLQSACLETCSGIINQKRKILSLFTAVCEIVSLLILFLCVLPFWLEGWIWSFICGLVFSTSALSFCSSDSPAINRSSLFLLKSIPCLAYLSLSKDDFSCAFIDIYALGRVGTINTVGLYIITP